MGKVKKSDCPCNKNNQNNQNQNNQNALYLNILKKGYFCFVFLGQKKCFKLPSYINTIQECKTYRQIKFKQEVLYTKFNMLIVDGKPTSVADFQKVIIEQFDRKLTSTGNTGTCFITDYSNTPFRPPINK